MSLIYDMNVIEDFLLHSCPHRPKVTWKNGGDESREQLQQNKIPGFCFLMLKENHRK